MLETTLERIATALETIAAALPRLEVQDNASAAKRKQVKKPDPAPEPVTPAPVADTPPAIEADPATDSAATTTAAASPSEPPFTPDPVPAPAPEPAPDLKQQLKEVAIAYASRASRDELVALLTQHFGVASLKALPEAQYAQAITVLEAA
jgi:hypothetical protein